MKKTLFLAATALAMLASCSQNDDLNSAPVVAEVENNAITFGTYVGGVSSTRAGEKGPIIATSSSDFKTAEYVLHEKGGFGVFAYHKTGASSYTYTGTTTYAPDFMYNQKVDMATANGEDGSTKEKAKDVATWSYSPIKYWPNEFAASEVDANSPEARGLAAEGNVSFFAYGPYANFGADLNTDATANITGLNNTTDVVIAKENVKTAASYAGYHSKNNKRLGRPPLFGISFSQSWFYSRWR